MCDCFPLRVCGDILLHNSMCVPKIQVVTIITPVTYIEIHAVQMECEL